MKKIFSQLGLLNNRLKEIETRNTKRGYVSSHFLKKGPWLKSNVTLWLNISSYDLFRAEILVEDLIALAGEDLEFNVDMLIILLYEDFLRQIRAGEELKTLLNRLYQKHSNIFEETYEYLEQENYYTLKLHKTTSKKKNKYTQFPIEISRQSAIRGEVLLYDLYKIDDNFSMSLEELLSLLFIDFVRKIQTTGNETKTIRGILARLTKE
ncbi:MAG: hypothetical protein ACH0QD_04615 [Tepidibacillus sp.]